MVNEPTVPAPEDEGGAHDRLLRVGPFRLLERLGKGGMGIVYLAERKEPVPMRVALKVIRSDRLGKAYRARFAMEQEALARMEHPNVARLLDAGDDEGQSWFAMEYVPGRPLTDYCREHKLTLPQRLELFIQVCDGVQHAHMRGILHRDLKPDNVLVRELDGRPVAKIIDFGLAQPADPLQIRATLHEGLRDIVGTLAYMSPEQARRTEGDLDTRTDVYSLGVVLYELLTGELPLDADEIERRGPDWFLVGRRDYEPPKPSTRLSSLGERLGIAAAERRMSPHRLRAFVRGDLDWVTMKALASDRQDRYPTVRDLGRDVARFLQHRPVEAGPPGSWYVLRKWARRHVRGLAATAALGAAAVAIGLGFAELHARARRAERRQEVLDRAAVLAEHVQRADTLWPADDERVPLLERWLADAERLAAVGASLDALAAELANEASDGDEFDGATIAVQKRLVEQRRSAALELARLVPVVTARLERARTLVARTVEMHEGHWVEAIAAVRKDERFDGFELRYLPGLVPLGANAQGLQEFYLLDSAGSALLPVRRPDGGFDVGPMTGLVLVLVPGGWLAVKETKLRGERLQHPWSARVRPFLLSRYEMTQAQWARLAGEALQDPNDLREHNPSNTPPLQRRAGGDPEPDPPEGKITWDAVQWIHPVQQVSWQDAVRLLPRWSLRLPTAAEWVRAASGGGDDRDCDFGWLFAAPAAVGNFAWAQESGSESFEPCADGFEWTAPVGSLAANPFGLHDVFGNVAEFCADGFFPGMPGDMVPDARRSGRAVIFGYSFREACRPGAAPFLVQMPIQNIGETTGLRPAFAVGDER